MKYIILFLLTIPYLELSQVTYIAHGGASYLAPEYAVNAPQMALKMIELGATGITTDRPKWLKDQINSLEFDK